MSDAYRSAGLDVEARVTDLLGRMTLDEKVAQLMAVWLVVDLATGEVAPSQTSFGGTPAWTPVQALERGIGHITRPLGTRPVDPLDGARQVNEIQRRLIEGTRLGIPAICHEECLSGAMFAGATSFPAPLNLASTWDPELVERVGRAIGRELACVGARQGLAPVADVCRDARWGRVEETMGEDPYLAGVMVSSYVRGLQGPDPATGVIATLKHFCGYSSSEGGRNFAPAHIGERELRDVFLVPFEMAVVEAGAGSVMNAYQEIDGEPPAASRRLLTEVLRDEWGFEGIVVSDYGSIAFLQTLHRVAADSAEAAALAVHAGLDVELPNPVDFAEGVPEALRRALLSMDEVDEAVARVLRAKFRLGLFERPYADLDAVHLTLRSSAHVELCADVARRSVTLLHNDGILPLDARRLGRMAVLGPNADDNLALFGNYSYENHILSTHFGGAVDRSSVPSVLDAVRTKVGEAGVTHAAGCSVSNGDTSGIAEAATLATDADVALLVLGDRAGHFNLGTVGEGSDADDLHLPGGQAALLDAVLATGTPTVVVLLAGRPHDLSIAAGSDGAGAIVQAWFPGEPGATAIVDVLFGDAEPGGRSVVTFSRGAGTQPRFYNHRTLSGGLPRQPRFEPVFCFGHGLSYTTFAYSDLRVTPATIPPDGEVAVSCTVTNTGGRAGEEVVQLYLTDPLASVTRPTRELKGFARLALEPGGAARVGFVVPADLLAFTGIDHRRRVEPGRVLARVGASSEDIRLRGEFEVSGDVRFVGSRRRQRSDVSVTPVVIADVGPPAVADWRP